MVASRRQYINIIKEVRKSLEEQGYLFSSIAHNKSIEIKLSFPDNTELLESCYKNDVMFVFHHIHNNKIVVTKVINDDTHIDGKIVVSYILVVDNIYFDDDMSITTSIHRGRISKYLVHREHMVKIIMAVIFGNDIDKQLLYKNKPKMKSSEYGARLHDISVTCIND